MYPTRAPHRKHAVGFRQPARLFAFVLLGQLPLPAQEQKGQDILLLNPFTVEADAVEGYRATTTLAGTRIKTDLKDIASTISVYTKEFLEDTGATNLQELLVYTTGTEVAGKGGNLTNSSDDSPFSLDYTAERFAANSTTRVRGLAAADNTRNYFASNIPFDSYNTETVTINRGANNILFGLGSPAGIIDRTLSRPRSVNATELSFQTDRYGSLRSTFDVNRVVLRNKLNIRLMGLHDWKEFQQEPTFDKSRRLYGAVDFTPRQSMRIRVNVEVGDRDGSPEVLAPPRDRLNPWWTQLNQATIGPGQTLPFTDIIGNNRNPVFLYGFGATQATDGIITLNSGVGLQGAILRPTDALYNLVPANQRANYNPQFSTLNDPNRALRNSNPLSIFSRSPQILDTSVFDYNNLSLSGRNDRRFDDFNAYNVALQHEWLKGNLGVELVHDRQNFNSGFYDLIGGGFRNRNIGVDLNRNFADGTPNPNVGRPFVTAAPTWSESQHELETTRLTAFSKLDARQWLGNRGRWLGRHTLTGLLDRSRSRTFNIRGPGLALDTDFGRDIGYQPANNLISGLLASQTLFYVGESLLGKSSSANAHIGGLPPAIKLPEQVLMRYISTPTRYFAAKSYQTFVYPRDKGILTTNARLESNQTRSMALAWQSHWLDDTLVTTLGWRDDRFRNYDAGAAAQDNRGTRLVGSDVYRLPDAPVVDTSGRTFSWGAVAHAPKRLRKKLPLGMDVSVHYSESENFAPNSVSRHPYGGFFSPPAGTTRDYGAAVSLFDQKLVARLTWYRTIQENLTDSRLAGPYSWFFLNVPVQVYNNNPAAAIAAAKFELPAKAIQEAYHWTYRTNPNGSVSIEGDDIGAGDVIQAVSKGFEMDVTANLTRGWRLALNAAQQYAVRSGTATTGLAEVERLAAAWLGNPAQGDLLENNNNPVRGRISQQLGLIKTALAYDGQRASELREWRVNVVSNFTFPAESRLKGFGFGGAWRYQSKSSIGTNFALSSDPNVGYYPLVDQPVWGPSDAKVDAWLTYKTKIRKNTQWILRFNLRNVLNDDDLIPTFYNPDGTGFVYRSAKQRDWNLTSTFRF